MARTSTIPAETVTEAIRNLEEITPDGDQGGLVRVMVGRVDASGAFIVPQAFATYEISGERFAELCGPATSWAPDKPAGTYRNDDVWHFVDLMREEAANPTPAPTPQPA